MSDLTVFTYPPAWRLPSACPFAVKLLAWLNLNGLSYCHVVHDTVEGAPTGSSPWIEVDGVPVGETDEIIAFLADLNNIPASRNADVDQHAFTPGLKRTFEEQFHKVMEYEMLIHPLGIPGFEAVIARQPAAIAAVQKDRLRHRLRNYLDDCGFTGLGPKKIEALGRTILGRLVDVIERQQIIGGAHPSIVELSVFGQLAPLRNWPMRTPIAEHVKSSTVLCRWCDTIQERCRM
ncbi:hypothetical protein [Hoeflea halophila]|nr:hypothetical protein [Hoeflea halophila]